MPKKRKSPPRAKHAARAEVSEDVREDFDERQGLADGGRQALQERLAVNHSETPELSGGDVDADWDKSLEGSESVGGHVPTPDQDQVDEIGQGAGLTYADDEPLDYGKVSRRDADRWELNPASADDTLRAAKALDEDDLYDLGYPQAVDEVFENKPAEGEAGDAQDKV